MVRVDVDGADQHPRVVVKDTGRAVAGVIINVNDSHTIKGFQKQLTADGSVVDEAVTTKILFGCVVARMRGESIRQRRVRLKR